MKARGGRLGEPGAIQLVEEAFVLLRRLPLSVILTYFAGAVPFVLGLLFYWADMSRGARAYSRCAAGAWGLALLFVWMKSCQAVFAANVSALVRRLPPPDWTARRLLRVGAVQAALQPLGLVALPVALLVVVPFHWVYAFYQHLSLAGDGRDPDLKAAWRRAAEHARLWPLQGHLLLWFVSPWLLGLTMAITFGGAWLFAAAVGGGAAQVHPEWFWAGMALFALMVFPASPLGCVVALNVGVLLIAVPALLNQLLGIENVFSRGATYSVMNTTFVMAVYGICYLCLDPLVKIAYVLRAFYGDALKSGDDLRADLESCRAARSRWARRAGAAMLLAAALGAGPAWGGEAG